MISAVILDLDNTLYPYAPCDAAGVLSMSEAYSEISGRDEGQKFFDELLSKAKKEVKSDTAGTAASHNRLLYAQKLCEFSGCFSAENVLKLYNAYWDAFIAQMQLFEGAFGFIEDLHARDIKVGICSDLTAHIQMRKLIRLGLSDIIDAVVTSEECGAEKPAKEPFLLTLKKLGVSPSDTIMIGDDYAKDIIGAQNVGMIAIQFGGADHVYHAADYEEIGRLVRGWLF